MIEFLMYINFFFIVIQVGIMAVGWLTYADYYVNLNNSAKELYWMFTLIFLGTLLLAGIVLYFKLQDAAFAFSQILHATLALYSIVYAIVLVLYICKWVLSIRNYFGKKRNRI